MRMALVRGRSLGVGTGSPLLERHLEPGERARHGPLDLPLPEAKV